MRKILSLFLLTILFSGHLSAQTRVQGHLHPTAKHVPAKTESPLRSDQNFTFDDVKFWVGTGSNRAALVIEWHDGKQPDALVWGYRWDGEASGHDMIMAIAKADPRLVLLTQYTGPMGYTIDGIGYSENRGNMNLRYDLDAAISDSQVRFKFEPPFIDDRQVSFPQDPAADAAAAIQNGLQTGVIIHPFDANTYGYPAYDYDHWKCDNALHWAAGWYEGYWSYFVKDSWESDFMYSGLGATSRMLIDGSWDAWSYNANMSTWTGTAPGDLFLPAPKPGDPLPVAPEKPTPDPEPTPDEPEQIVPDITPTETEVTFSFPEFPEASYYVIQLYKRVNGKDAFDRMLKVAPDGTILESRSLRANQVSLHLDNLDPGSEWHAIINAVKETGDKETVIGQADVTFHTTGGEAPEPGTFTPEVKASRTDVIFTFSKITGVSHYIVRLYKVENGKETLSLTAQTTAEGSIIAITRAGGNKVQIRLDNLEPETRWRVEIDAIQDSEVIGKANVTFETKDDTTTSIEESTAEKRGAYYASGNLHILNLQGYTCRIITLNGQLVYSMHVSSESTLLPISLSNGIYILVAQKQGERKTFKFIITNTKL